MATAMWFARMLGPANFPVFGSEAETGKPTSANVPQPRIQVDAPRHDFGRVQQGAIVQHEFKIINRGERALDVVDVRPSCGCTTASDWTRTIAPHGTGTIPVFFETSGFSGAVAKSITVFSNDPVQPVMTLEIAATVWSPVRIAQSLLVLPTLRTGEESVTASTIIRNDADEPLQLQPPRSESPWLHAEVRTLEAGRAFELRLTTVPRLTPGSHTAKVRLETSNPNVRQISVQAMATVLPPIQIVPSEITLPPGPLSSAETRHIVVVSNRGLPLRVEELTCNAPGLTWSTQSSPDGQQVTITVRAPAGFQVGPDSTQFFSAKITDRASPELRIPIRASVR